MRAPDSVRGSVGGACRRRFFQSSYNQQSCRSHPRADLYFRRQPARRAFRCFSRRLCATPFACAVPCKAGAKPPGIRKPPARQSCPSGERRGPRPTGPGKRGNRVSSIRLPRGPEGRSTPPYYLSSCRSTAGNSFFSVSVSSRSPHAHSTSANYTSERGGGVSARAHACVALGRCVAFGRPKMSVWGHAGARHRLKGRDA